MENCKVLFLTCNENAMDLYEWLRQKEKVEIIKDKLTIDMVKECKPDLIISYNYSYLITTDIIEYMKGAIFNLHISYLPWNRGASPNLWSFLDNTPKGVTIHQVDKGLDTGKILFQKQCYFDESRETFASTYTYLHEQIKQLLKENWEKIKSGTYVLMEQKKGGSYHNIKELEKLKKECPFKWSDNISEYIDKYSKYKNNKSKQLWYISE